MVVTVRSDEELINWDATGDERIVENVRNIIRTMKYEVPFLRNLGISSDVIESSHIQFQERIHEEIVDTIATYESRANVLDVEIEAVDGDGSYTIVVNLEV